MKPTDARARSPQPKLSAARSHSTETHDAHTRHGRWRLSRHFNHALWLIAVSRSLGAPTFDVVRPAGRTPRRSRHVI